ncbi:site-specific integrase [uncultured Paludibaculum sp.]|uniref:tyrosine-type recombinase/integrase n=1 Tax=uncultured Paludibaculum sp. TaxID=1765020 RepID=UPI002AAC3ADD|nr:site-specific integrase [uncultured Paludibaculum sp.]
MKGKSENVEFQIGIDLFSVFDNFVEVRQRPHDPKPLRGRTVRSYKQARDAFQIALRRSTDGLSLKRMVADVIDEKLKSGTMTATGMNVYIRALNSFFSWCYDMGHLSGRIKIALIEVERRKRPKVLSDDGIQNWKQFRATTLSQLRAQCLALLILDTGLRIEECLGLRETDLDWTGDRLWVKGKGGSNREAPVSTEGRKLLKRYIATTVAFRAGEDSFVFSTKSGKPLSYRNSLRDLKSIAKRLNAEWVGWHSLRRTFATAYLKNGGVLTDLQEILGHADTRTTLLYLGKNIDDIVDNHDQRSPLAVSHKRRSKSRAAHADHLNNIGSALAIRFRQRR